MRRGLDWLFLDIEEIEIDNPLCYEEISTLLVHLHKAKCICEKLITRIPEEIVLKLKENKLFATHFTKVLSLMEGISEVKDWYKDLIQNYLHSGSTEDIKKYLSDEDHILICHLFVRWALEIGFDWEMNDREMISQLIKKCYHEFMFSYMDFALAFDHFLQNLEEYAVDVPRLIEVLPLFIARSVHDQVIAPSYILFGESFSKDDS